MMRYVTLVLFCVLCLLVGCPGQPQLPDGETKENTTEQSSGKDAGATKDDGTKDTTSNDTGDTKDDVLTDTGTPDKGNPTDDALTDKGGTDTGTPDQGTTDQGTQDAGDPDTGTPDTTNPTDDTLTDQGGTDQGGTDSTLEPVTDAGGTDTTTQDNGTQDTTPDTTPDTTNPDATPDTAGMTCQERASNARKAVESVRTGNLACATTKECTSVATGTGCYGACPSPVNTSGKTKVEGAIQKVNATYCKDYRKDGCPYATPRCVNTSVVCKNKVCTALSCTDRRTEARNRVQTAVKSNSECVNNSDCVLIFTSTGCAGACQSAVNKKGESAVKAEIAAINSGICANYRGDGCPYASPSCAAVKAACVNKVCTTMSR